LLLLEREDFCGVDGGTERVDLEERRSFAMRRKLGMSMPMLNYGWRYG